MKKYLLDTNICVFFIRGKYDLREKIRSAGKELCSISEITVAELMFGAECSNEPAANRIVVNELVSQFSIIPIFESIAVFAKEKARLRPRGNLISDFDLLIGSTAVTQEMVMVTDNVQHLAGC